jgi:glycine/D-amino acid oxidase-like deaminating enzyme/nitrite reductase/ring-hydroxylating ferredoxin subunit
MMTMNNDSGESISLWMDTASIPLTKTLEENLRTDVCIVGAGISGLTTAYLLLLEGKSVVVLDDGPVAGGESGRTTAHLVNSLDYNFTELEEMHGEKGAMLAADSHSTAIQRIESIVKNERIDCDFIRLDGYLFPGPGEDPDYMIREQDAAHRAGLPGVVKLDRAPLISFNTGPCLKFPNQAQFHPMKYYAGLVKSILERGGKIFTNTPVTSVEGGKNAKVKTAANFVISTSSIVMATNTPVNDLFAIHTKQAAYRSYVIGALIPRGSVTRGLYWDTADPFHYIRLENVQGGKTKNDILIIGGEDHKTGQDDDPTARFDCLEQWARERFPMILEIKYRWSGQVMEPVDKLAFIGRNPADADNVFVITGHSGNGMTYGTIGGILVTDLICGRKNKWEELYNPSRISLKATGTFLKENLNVAAQYADWLSGEDEKNAAHIKPGSGALMQKGISKIAVYRDNEGKLFTFSAACPHLGCVVNWNDTEKSWDCPCHGSRFSATGKVMNGPAISNLKPADS